jgi:hypothetical protein
MGLLDKAKAAATEAAIRAKETAEELQTKRELGQAYGELGQKTFALIDGDDLASPELDPLVERIRTLKAQLEPPEPVAATAAATAAEEATGEPESPTA